MNEKNAYIHMVIYVIILLSFFEFLLGSLFHFLYDFFPYPFIAIFSAINESVFEHLKLLVYPMLLGYIGVYWIKDLNMKKYGKAILCGVFSGLAFLLMIYYFVRYGLGVESLIFDILLLFVSIVVGNYVSYYVYRYSDESFWKFSYVVLSLLIFLMILGTFFPPSIPLFQEEKAVVTLLQ